MLQINTKEILVMKGGVLLWEVLIILLGVITNLAVVSADCDISNINLNDPKWADVS
jgi:hypothetical protein